MFTGCKKFNKPLNNWITSQVTDMSYMFLECPIKNDNKPIVKPEKDYKKEKLEVEEELIKQHLHPSRIASIINSTTDGIDADYDLSKELDEHPLKPSDITRRRRRKLVKSKSSNSVGGSTRKKRW
jgi:surface protein